MPPLILLFLVLAVLGLGYYVRSVLRTRSAFPTLMLLVLSLVIFVLFSVYTYNFNVVGDETGTAEGMSGQASVLGLLSLGLGVASLAVHLRARRSSG